MGDEERIASILAEWIEARDRGEQIDPEEVIAAHPGLADELRRRFRALSLMERAIEEGASPHLRPLPQSRYGDFRVAGEGGMGIVYWALDTDLNRQVAFKIVRPAPGGERKAPSVPIGLTPPTVDTPASQAFETLKARFLQEAWVTAGLEHPGIVPVYELGATPEGVPYYTMRFVKGSRTLQTAIDDAVLGDVEERLALLEPFLKVCDTIRYAHAHGVIHRDLKPENIAIGEFGEVVVLDWGLAKMRDRPDTLEPTWQERLREYREAKDLKTMASALGTPGYMSPEAAMGKVEEVDERSDVYSLGAILFKILTGRLPFRFETYLQLVRQLQMEEPQAASELDPSVPEELSRICARAVARDREERFGGAGELAEAIRSWQRESALEREVRELLAKAEAAFAATDGLTGEALLRQLDRATSACARIEERVPGHVAAAELVRRSEAARQRAIREQARAGRRKLLARGGVSVLVLGIVAASLVAKLLSESNRRTGRALDRARALGLVQASERVRHEDPMLALMLAREAGRITLQPEVQTRLHQALGDSLERATLRGHEAPILDAAFSPLDDRIVTASADHTARIWDRSGAEVAVLEGHDDEVTHASFSPSGQRVLTVSDDGTARLWDRQGGEVAVLGDRGHEVVSGRFSPSAEIVLGVTRDSCAALWSADGSPIAVLRGHSGPVKTAKFSRAGDRILTVSEDRTARLWDLQGNQIASFSGEGREIWTAVFTPDGVLATLVPSDSQDVPPVLAWSLEQGGMTALQDHASPVWWADFILPETLLTISTNGEARLYTEDGPVDLHPPRPFRAYELGRQVFQKASPPELWWPCALTGGFITKAYLPVYVKSVDVVILWNSDGEPFPALASLEAKKEHLRACRISDRHRVALFVWDRRKAMVARDLMFGGEHHWLHSPEDGMASARLSPRGDRILAVCADDTARMWASRPEELLVHAEGWVGDKPLEFSPSGDLLLSWSDENAILWDDRGKIVAHLRGHADTIGAAAFSPSGDRILTTSRDGTARLWSTEGDAITVLRDVDRAFFSPSGEWILSGGAGLVRRWDRTGTHPTTLAEGVDLSAISPDGRFFLTRSHGQTSDLWQIWDADGTRGVDLGSGYQAVFNATSDRIIQTEGNQVRIWDIRGEKVASFEDPQADSHSIQVPPEGGHFLMHYRERVSGRDRWRVFHRDGRESCDLSVRVAAFSADGQRVLTGSADGSVWIRDLEGKKLQPLEGHTTRIHDVCASPSGDRFAAVAEDGTVRLWDQEGRLRAVLTDTPAPGPGRVAFSPGGDRLLTGEWDEGQGWGAHLRLVYGEDLLELADERITRDFTPEERRLYGDLLDPAGEDLGD